jgi:hypothetical protein
MDANWIRRSPLSAVDAELRPLEASHLMRFVEGAARVDSPRAERRRRRRRLRW